MIKYNNFKQLGDTSFSGITAAIQKEGLKERQKCNKKDAPETGDYPFTHIPLKSLIIISAINTRANAPFLLHQPNLLILKLYLPAVRFDKMIAQQILCTPRFYINTQEWTVPAKDQQNCRQHGTEDHHG